MTDITAPLIAAVADIITRADEQRADPTWTAHAILTALRGRGWRPTNVEPAPDWQKPNGTPAPPNAEYRAARPPSREDTHGT